MSELPPDGGAGPIDERVEVRVHGIGYHDDWSGLGHPVAAVQRLPPVVTETWRGRKDSLEIAEPPTIPAHPIRLVNWSKTSRKNAKLLWYLALPFTLVNVAAYMGPSETTTWAERARLWLKVSVWVSGLAVTALATAWLMALAEGVLWFDVTLGVHAHQIACAVAAGVLPLGVVLRRLTRADNCTNWTYVGAHVAVVAAFGSYIIFGRPAQYAPWLHLRAIVPASQAPDAPGLDRLDAMVAVSVAAMALCALCAVGLLFCRAQMAREARRADLDQARPTSTEERHALPPALAGAALLIALAPILLCLVGSIVNVCLGWATHWVASVLRHGGVHLTTGVDAPSLVIRPGFVAGLVSAQNPNGNANYPLDMVGVVTLGILLAVVVAFGLVLLFHPRGPRYYSRVASLDQPDAGGIIPGEVDAFESLAARTTATLAETIVPTIVLSAVIIGVAALVGVLVDLPITPRVRAVTGSLLVEALVVLIILIAVGSLRSLHRKVTFVADLAAFWDVTAHPLSGTSYRRGVVAGLHYLLESQWAGAEVALVGHSQGSVICAAYVQELKRLERLRADDPDGTSEQTKRHPLWWATTTDTSQIHLVTCGTPLSSLYATFFPLHFHHEFFGSVATAVASWDNFWRSSDPIATPLAQELADPDAEAVQWAINDYWLADPARRRNVRLKHSDYWVDPIQVGVIEARLAPPRRTSVRPRMPSLSKIRPM